jgi:hypothetical protein
MLLAATSSNWNQKNKYEKPKIRISSNSSSFRISTTRELKFVCAPTNSAAERSSSARLKTSSLCVVRARVSLRAGEGETGTAGWYPAGEAGTVCIFSLSFVYFFLKKFLKQFITIYIFFFF